MHIQMYLHNACSSDCFGFLSRSTCLILIILKNKLFHGKEKITLHLNYGGADKLWKNKRKCKKDPGLASQPGQPFKKYLHVVRFVGNIYKSLVGFDLRHHYAMPGLGLCIWANIIFSIIYVLAKIFFEPYRLDRLSVEQVGQITYLLNCWLLNYFNCMSN
jgi:hypothetical protein